MPCLFVVLALLAPGFMIVLVWPFTTWFQGFFNILFWPFLWLIFLSTTLLWYTAVQNLLDGVWPLGPVPGLVATFSHRYFPGEGGGALTRDLTQSGPETAGNREDNKS